MNQEQRKIKAGDLVIITHNASGHGFDIGEIVQVRRTSSFSVVGEARPDMKTGPNFTRSECAPLNNGTNNNFKILLVSEQEKLT